MALTYIKIENEPIDSNCFILFDEDKSNRCLIIDPGSENAFRIDNMIIQYNLIPSYILLTHEHFDHCWSVSHLAAKYKIDIVCSDTTANLIKDSKKNFSLFYEKPFVVEGNTLNIESIDFSLHWEEYDLKFIYAKGHTSAGIFIIIQNYLITGDTLIPELKTVTKLLSGSKKGLQNSINFLQAQKGKDYTILPGHGFPFELDNYDLEKAL